MAGNTINLSIRLESELKSEAEKLLSDFGMSMTTAINIYLRQMVREQKIPFQISMHTRTMNLETLAAMQEALQLEKPGIGKTFRNIDELREDLLS